MKSLPCGLLLMVSSLLIEPDAVFGQEIEKGNLPERSDQNISLRVDPPITSAIYNEVPLKDVQDVTIKGSLGVQRALEVKSRGDEDSETKVETESKTLIQNLEIIQSSRNKSIFFKALITNESSRVSQSLESGDTISVSDYEINNQKNKFGAFTSPVDWFYLGTELESYNVRVRQGEVTSKTEANLMNYHLGVRQGALSLKLSKRPAKNTAGTIIIPGYIRFLGGYQGSQFGFLGALYINDNKGTIQDSDDTNDLSLHGYAKFSSLALSIDFRQRNAFYASTSQISKVSRQLTQFDLGLSFGFKENLSFFTKHKFDFYPESKQSEEFYSYDFEFDYLAEIGVVYGI